MFLIQCTTSTVSSFKIGILSTTSPTMVFVVDRVKAVVVDAEVVVVQEAKRNIVGLMDSQDTTEESEIVWCKATKPTQLLKNTCTAVTEDVWLDGVG